MSLSPYWQSDDGAITVYHARCEDVLAAGLVPVREVALVHADPPYGQNEPTDRRARGRIGTPTRTLHKGALQPRDFPPIVGDDKPFDPTALLALQRPLVVWGGHRCSPALPPYPSWLIWGKRAGTTPDDNGDCELAWSNLGGPIREWEHLWRGTCRASETGTIHLHPTQKPVALSAYVFARAKLKPGALVFVPYLGSGPDLPAARAAGLRVIACEVERSYCDTAIARLGAVTPERAREPAGPLFAERAP